jgi:hypothetical protein
MDLEAQMTQYRWHGKGRKRKDRISIAKAFIAKRDRIVGYFSLTVRQVDTLEANSTRFYLRFGFVVSPLREQQLLLLLKDARRLLPMFNK